MLRLPDGMRERLADLAKNNKRSLNAEIVSRLEESFTAATEAATLRHTAQVNTELVDLLKRDSQRSRAAAGVTHLLMSRLVEELYRGKKPPKAIFHSMSKATSPWSMWC